jgi:putative transposase
MFFEEMFGPGLFFIKTLSVFLPDKWLATIVDLFIKRGAVGRGISITQKLKKRRIPMANTYSQIYIQIVFAVKGRQNLISSQDREQLQQYITGIVRNRGQKMFAIFAMPDHVHLLVSISPDISISDLVRDIKSSSSNFINKNKWVQGKFSWQEGYGAFSYSKSQVGRVTHYIFNQQEHHKKRTFKEEYVELLNKFEIEYDEKYLFNWIE